MGVKKFNKIFKPDREIVFTDLRNQAVAIDAMIEIYRSLLGISQQNMLIDSKGKPTIHLSVISALVLNLFKAGVNQIWVFDFDIRKSTREKKGNIHKQGELDIRKEKRKKAQKEIEKINTELETHFENELNKAIEEEKIDNEIKKKLCKLDSLKKRTFIVRPWMIEDIKFLLNKFDIPWIEAPEGYEAEHLAACLTKKKIVNAVLTPDADALLFGAKKIIKRDTSRGAKRKKKYYMYSLDNLLKKHKINQMDLIKIGICLGTDFNPKGIKGIGEKTVLKKFKQVDILLENPNGSESESENGSENESENGSENGSENESENGSDCSEKSSETDSASEYIKCIKNAFNQFNRECPLIGEKVKASDFFSVKPLSNKEKINELLDWMEKEKGYNRERREKLINNAIMINKSLNEKNSKKIIGAKKRKKTIKTKEKKEIKIKGKLIKVKIKEKISDPV